MMIMIMIIKIQLLMYESTYGMITNT
jgi:hypothetical protein